MQANIHKVLVNIVGKQRTPLSDFFEHFVEARISNELGMLKDYELERLESILKNAGLPTILPELAPDRLLEAMRHDKKVVAGKIRFALPKSIGEAFTIDDVSVSVIEKALVS